MGGLMIALALLIGVNTQTQKTEAFETRPQSSLDHSDKYVQKALSPVIPILPAKKRYFVGASLGVAKLGTSYTPMRGSFDLNPTDTTAASLGAEAGYTLDNEDFMSVEYSRVKLNDATLDNFLLSYNYTLAKPKYDLYVGVVAGISYIDVTKAPAADLDAKDVTGRSFAYGVQAGMEYPLEEDLTLYTQYRYLRLDHTTHLLSALGKADLTRESLQTLSFGVRKAF